MILNESTKLTQQEKQSRLCKNYFKIAYRCKCKNSKYLKKKYMRMSFNLEKGKYFLGKRDKALVMKEKLINLTYQKLVFIKQKKPHLY